MARRCPSIPHYHILQPWPHGYTPQSLTHDAKLQRLIPSMGWSIWGELCRQNLTLWYRRREELTQLASPQMLMSIRSCSVNRQVSTVSPMPLSLFSLSHMPITLRCAWMHWSVRSEPVLMIQRRRWLTYSHQGQVRVMFSSCVHILLYHVLTSTRVAWFPGRSRFIVFMSLVMDLFN